ncbi:hypothetical protein ABMA27_014457 [Loxostege sticticalis]|uniref:Uncharacterized protein n=1 Tax=Loxostege sticticalis TaxID=481309 RepID=A0ABR3I941_LOXSC
MNNSVGSAIEKIKLQEQDNEVKLKEKREYEATLSSLNRAIRETLQQVEMSEQEIALLRAKVDGLRAQLVIARTQRDALVGQLQACNKELDKLRAESEQGIMNVWELRSSLCTAVQEVADEYDIRALLIKPMQPEFLPPPAKKPAEGSIHVSTKEHEERLKAAIEKKEKAIRERDRLMVEPDVGDEFVRRCIRSRLNRKYSSKVEPNENEPIKFSTSPAARKTTIPLVRKSHNNDMPWYQPYSVVGSVAVFLLYFCVFRGENDVDLEFSKTLYERIKGLEKEQLIQTYRFNKEHGKSVEDIEKRLKELEAEESQLVA